ncbi:MAG: sigma 54-interacting transcriptional regulator, partial [Thermoanaerobaculia bacterium]
LASIARALAGGGLVAEGEPPDERYRFTRESDRAHAAAKLPRAARTDAVSRLERLALEPARWAPAALARGEERDVVAGRELLAALKATGDRAAVLALLRRESVSSTLRLCPPLEEFLIYSASGTNQEIERAAARLVSSDPDGTLDDRLSAACRLVRLGAVDGALALVPLGDAPSRAEILARTRVLLQAQRNDEAGTLLAALAAEPVGSFDAPEALRRALLSAEWNERRHDYAAAAAALKGVSRLLDALDSPELAWEAASTAGCLASDLGHTEEAVAYFRRARQEARTDRARGDSAVDLGVVAMHAGRFAEALEEMETALALFASEGNEDRYVSTLGNRAEVAMLTGDFGAARADLTRVLSHDRAAGREYQMLFALPSLQRLALLEGDLAGAAEWYRQSEPLSERFPSHAARRESLVLEGARLLQAGSPLEALERLATAGRLPDNRMMNEPLRLRLVASASLDAGSVGEPAVEPFALPGEEAILLRAEALLLAGGTLPLEARRELEARLTRGAGASDVAWRLLEWLGRFPAAFEGPSSDFLFELGSRAAARAGLAGAATRFREARPRTSGSFAILSPALPGHGFVAEDPAVRKLLALIARIARTALPVLILGESGTGKELIAREVHRLSGRRGRFVPLNVAALSGSLVESELFGHTRGSFTGAERDRVGLIEESSGGTLFLDEIGDLPLASQAKLLRVLQEREVSRVGENRVRRVDLRVVAATHRDLATMVGEGTFRFDLLQRLKGFEAVLPPLRARPRDLEALIAGALGDRGTLAPEARRLLMEHAWPGNVRELLSALETAQVLAHPAHRIEIAHFPFLKNRPEEEASDAPINYKQGVDDARRRLIEDALVFSHGNRTHAAKRLGMSRQSLLYEMKKFGL